MGEFVSHEWKVIIAITLIVLFVLSTLLLFVTILIIKFSRAGRTIRNTRFKNRVENKLNELISEYESHTPEDILKIVNLFKPVTKEGWQKTIFGDLLIHYTINLTGDIQQFLKEIFFGLALDQTCFQDLKRGNVREKVRAMRYLSTMGYKPACPLINKYVNDRRKLLRVEASLALIDLSENQLQFLDKLEYPLTQWQQINIYKKLSEKPPESLPAFQRWFDSKNPSIQAFAIEMASRFNQTSEMEKLLPLLENDSKKIKIKAIQSLIAFDSSDLVPILRDKLAICTEPDVKIELLAAIGSLSSDVSDTDLLETYLMSEDLSVRIQAARSILKMEDGSTRLARKNALYPLMLQPVIDHISNPLLR